MSTHSNIVALSEGKWKVIYCHFDSYPSGVGVTLHKNYRDQEKIDLLMKLGDLSGLGASVECPVGHTYDTPVKGHCVAYGRDRGEQGCETREYSSLEEANSGGAFQEEYAYVWNGEEWWMIDEHEWVDRHLLRKVMMSLEEFD